MVDEETQNASSEKLPFDIATLMKGLWTRRWVFLICLGVSLALATLAALFVAKRQYTATTVLLYKPENSEPGSPPVTLQTQMNLVKIRSNLEEVRERLKLPVDLERLGKNITVSIEKNADLMIIEAVYETAAQAADLANTARDIFLEHHRNRYRSEFDRRISEMNHRLETVQQSLKSADKELGDFKAANGISDLTEQAKWDLDQAKNIEGMYVQASVDVRRVELQRENYTKILHQLSDQARTEEKQRNGVLENLDEMNHKFRRLRDAIADDKTERSNQALLREKELKLKTMKDLYAKGAATKQEVDEATAAYESTKALAIDTDQVKEWKKQISEIDKSMIPKDNTPTPSGRAMQEMMVKAFDIELEGVAVREKVKVYKQMLDDVKARLARLPGLQQKLAELTRNMEALQAERVVLEKAIADLRKLAETKQPDFRLESEAVPPVLPTKSYRKLFFIGITFGGMMITFMVLLLLELKNSTLRSVTQAELKLGLPILGAVPLIHADQANMLTDVNSPLLEEFRILTRHLRMDVPGNGVKILITAAQHGEGATTIAINLARCLGRQDERVLLLDGRVRPEHNGGAVGRLMLPGSENAKGLGEYLSFQADTLEEVVHPTQLVGVETLPRVEQAVIPDLLGSKRMKLALDELSARYNVIVLDGPPTVPHVDAELIAQWCDAIVLVVRGGVTPAAVVKKAVARLRKSQTPIVGVILNGIDPLFL